MTATAQPAEAPTSGSAATVSLFDQSVLVVVPTYNELANLEAIITRVRVAVPAAHVLVVDDNSPDGTGRLADRLAGMDQHIHVLHRPSKQGLGPAYLTGFSWGAARHFDALVQMDADGSHQPEELPRLLASLRHADLVVGSRWVPEAKVRNWPLARRLISRGGSAYARLALGLPTKDVTGGYHAVRTSTLPRLQLDTVASHGYTFQIDLLRRSVRAGLRVVEVPITFADRESGVSKMSLAIVVEALWRVTLWGVQRLPAAAHRRWGPLSSVRARPRVAAGSQPIG
jgi:dolichol-phosphate mannosyltransferase